MVWHGPPAYIPVCRFNCRGSAWARYNHRKACKARYPVVGSAWHERAITAWNGNSVWGCYRGGRHHRETPFGYLSRNLSNMAEVPKILPLPDDQHMGVAPSR